MKKLSLLLSLCCCFLLTGNAYAAVTNSNAKPQPQSYFLSEPNQSANTQSQAVTSPAIAPQATPLRSNTNSGPQPASLQAPAYNPPAYAVPGSNAQPTLSTKSPVNNAYTTPQSYGQSYSQSQYQAYPQGYSQNPYNTSSSQGNNQEGYRYLGQGLSASDACCDQPEPADQACGDCYCLYCHYRPCYYYTTECEYVPQYEYQRCCRYVPQYYNETRCRQVPQYYKVMRCKTVKEPYCVTRCCNVEHYNEETCCCETIPQYYQETCYRDVPQYYEETCCRNVPQYYEETCCRYVPQYYYTCQCKYCPQYKYQRQCKYIPQYYYKHETNCNQGGMQGPQCCPTP